MGSRCVGGGGERNWKLGTILKDSCIIPDTKKECLFGRWLTNISLHAQ